MTRQLKFFTPFLFLLLVLLPFFFSFVSSQSQFTPPTIPKEEEEDINVPELTASKFDEYVEAKREIVIYAYQKFHEESDKHLYTTKSLTKLLANYAVVTKLNVGREEALADELKIKKVPSYVLISPGSETVILDKEKDFDVDAVANALLHPKPTAVFGPEEREGFSAFLSLKPHQPKVIFLFSENPFEARSLSVLFRNKILFAKIPYDVNDLTIKILNATRIPSLAILTPVNLPDPQGQVVLTKVFEFDPRYRVHWYPATKWTIGSLSDYFNWLLKFLADNPNIKHM